MELEVGRFYKVRNLEGRLVTTPAQCIAGSKKEAVLFCPRRDRFFVFKRGKNEGIWIHDDEEYTVESVC